MYCTLVHFTWEMCALAVPLKLVQLGYKAMKELEKKELELRRAQ